MKKDNKTHVGGLLSMEKVHGLKKKISDQVQNKVDIKSFKNISKVSINLMFLYLNWNICRFMIYLDPKIFLVIGPIY